VFYFRFAGTGTNRLVLAGSNGVTIASEYGSNPKLACTNAGAAMVKMSNDAWVVWGRIEDNPDE